MTNESALNLISGLWDSNWGIVVLQGTPDGSTGNITVSGYWGAEDHKKGIIHSGTFNPESKILEFQYSEIYRGALGSGQFDPADGTFEFKYTEQLTSIGGRARLILDADGCQFTGPFVELGGGNCGNWTMTRTDTDNGEPRTLGGISGLWDSGWGPVMLKHGSISGTQQVAVTGYWGEDEDAATIKITEGNLITEIGVFDFVYFDSNRNLRGSCCLVLAPGGEVMSGIWSDAAESGSLTLRR